MTTMTSLTRRWTAAMLGVAALSAALAPGLALAQDAPVPDKGDTAWMLVSTLLVVLMTVPGLALFYGGLVRAKNILSVLMQVMVGFSLIVVLWCIYGYSLALTEGNAFIGGLDRLFLSGTFDPATGSFATAATFTDGVVLTELLFVAFQATFAGITCCLIIGAFAERMRFSAVLIFMVIWFTICYIQIAHMVWGPGGLLLEEGALDFAGGTVVHINAGVAGLVGAYMVGKRVGLGREPMPPPQPRAHHGRRLAAVGGLVRLQRRFRARGQRLCGIGLLKHVAGHGRRRGRLVRRRVDPEEACLDAGRGVGRDRGPRRHHTGRG